MTTRLTDDKVGEAVKALPLRLRRIYVVAHVQRLPRTEIASALGISPQRVERRLGKALERCVRHMA